MRKDKAKGIVEDLLKSRGRTFAEEIGIDFERNRAEALFELLYSTILFSVRIGWKTALNGAAKLRSMGWNSAERMAATTWEERVKALDEARYVRYDESRSRLLGRTAQMVRERYGGDLENLRKKAGYDPARERELIKEFPGIGDTGADIFFREAQAVWEEWYPFVDAKAAQGARRLGLPAAADSLAGLVSRREFPRLVAALVREALDRKARREPVPA